MFEVMFWPLVACILLPGLLVYLGLHVIQREIIFIDIAMAQIASLGTCVAVLLHYNLNAPITFAISLGFTLVGASIFCAIRKRMTDIPLEAVIGIVYVLAAASAVLILSRVAEGDEQIKNMLVGNILLITPGELWKTFGLFTVVGAFHWTFRRQFLALSFTSKDGSLPMVASGKWDFLFYASIGLVSTSFVRIAGVLMVFTYLIVPATCAIKLAGSISARLIVGCVIAMVGGVAGLFFSFWFDFPSGATIVCTFGGLMFFFIFCRQHAWKILGIQEHEKTHGGLAG